MAVKKQRRAAKPKASAKKKKPNRIRLIEEHHEEALRQRGTELIGIGMIVFAVILWLIFTSYHADDPGFLSSSSNPAQNTFGRLGAALAGPFMFFTGYGTLALPIALAVWGVRLVIHRGEERIVSRLITVPLMWTLASIYASTHEIHADWPHNFGLGGVFGDWLLTPLVTMLPLPPMGGLRVVAVLLAGALALVSLYALGFTRRELRSIWSVIWEGAVWLYAGIADMLGLAGGKAAELARERKAAMAEGRAAKADTQPARAPEPAPSKPGFLSRLSGNTEASPAQTQPASGGMFSRLRDTTEDLMGSGAPQRPEAAPVTPTPAAEVPSAPAPDRHTAPAPRPSAPARPAAPKPVRDGAFELPDQELLRDPATVQRTHRSDDELESQARALEGVLDDYGVKGDIGSAHPGPVVTLYELEPAPGLKASRVIGLSDDIARSMSAVTARVSTVPGRNVIGIELPNDDREMVLLREIFNSREFEDPRAALPLALGKDIGGAPIVANLAKMPHLLIAGTTGSGKSVAINTMILSLLYRLSPEECRLIMIDPKMLELSVYDGIPHLLSPVVTDPKKAVVALKWTVAEMEERYRKMSRMGVRNIDGYNARVKEALAKGENFTRTIQTGFDDDTGEPVFETEETTPEAMPYIVVIVDEMADLMMVAGKEIEACIQRLAQMARASGIHLIMATQRPSVDVITGTIKANFPTRISFQVTSKIDSRTILGEMGAEQLLGQGDMLYMASGGRVTRVHGPFVSDAEVEKVVNDLKAKGAPEYEAGVLDGPDDDAASDIDLVLGLGGNTDGEDAQYDQAVQIVLQDRKCSTSYIQRKLGIGYNKAARLVEQMEENGVVSAANHVGKREILVPERGGVN
ncbi:DNA translocase FtsK [Paracoccaceae bacterium GXU_MW_L88]